MPATRGSYGRERRYQHWRTSGKCTTPSLFVRLTGLGCCSTTRPRRTLSGPTAIGRQRFGSLGASSVDPSLRRHQVTRCSVRPASRPVVQAAQHSGRLQEGLAASDYVSSCAQGSPAYPADFARHAEGPHVGPGMFRGAELSSRYGLEGRPGPASTASASAAALRGQPVLCVGSDPQPCSVRGRPTSLKLPIQTATILWLLAWRPATLAGHRARLLTCVATLRVCGSTRCVVCKCAICGSTT